MSCFDSDTLTWFLCCRPQVSFLNDTAPAPLGGVPVTAAVSFNAPLTTSGVKVGAPMDLTGLFATPVIITNTSRATVQICCLLDWAAHLLLQLRLLHCLHFRTAVVLRVLLAAVIKLQQPEELPFWLTTSCVCPAAGGQRGIARSLRGRLHCRHHQV